MLEIILIVIIMLEIILIVSIIILYNELALDHVQLVTLAMIRGEFWKSLKMHFFLRELTGDSSFFWEFTLLL